MNFKTNQGLSLRNIIFTLVIPLFFYFFSLFSAFLAFPLPAKMFLSFYVFILFPGHLLSLLLFHTMRRTALLHLFFSFASGLLFLSVFSLIGYVFQTSLTFIFFLVIALTFILTLLIVLLPYISSLRFSLPTFSETSSSIFPVLIILFLMLFISFVGYTHPAPDTGDIWYNMAVNREMVILDAISPFIPILNIPEIDPAYGLNTWYVMTSLMVKLSGVDPVFFNTHLSFLVLPFFLVAFFAFGMRLFENNQTMGYLSAILGFLFLVIQPFLDYIYYSGFQRYIMLFFIMPFLFYLTFEYLSRPTTSLRFIIAITVSLFSWFHSMVLFLFFLALVFFALGVILFSKSFHDVFSSQSHFHRIVLLFFLSFLLSTPTILVKFFNYGAGGIPPTYPTQLFLSKTLFLINPISYLKMPVILSLFVCVPLFFFKREKIWSVFLVSLFFFPLIVLFTPPLITFLSTILSIRLLVKMDYLMPLVYLLAYGLFIFLSFITTHSFFSQRKKTIVFLIVPLILFGALLLLVPASANLTKGSIQAWKTKQPFSLKPTELFMQETLTPGSTLTSSDVIANLAISSRVPVFVLTIYGGHLPSLNLTERVQAMNIIFNSSTSINDTLMSLQTYNITYIYVNTEKDDPQKFVVSPLHFREVYSKDGKMIFQMNQ
ncbi:hypothetical protein HYW21_08045 [Candidatus Woesearchaeota archaeon]|nr:hypothetical protein [Candidatus Woesearchaeota archaeon]